MFPFLKICGITRREDALFCAEAGAGALGAVFYPRSPRNVTAEQARDIFADLPADIARVGIFVNRATDEIILVARTATLTTVQLHGEESTADILALQSAGLHVVKVLKTTGRDLLAYAQALPAGTGILVECGRGDLPGGNAAAWDWADAAILADNFSFGIAGGIAPDNLAAAARASRAGGFDASSSIEAAPGIKDKASVLAYVQAAAQLPLPAQPFFWKGPP